MARYLILAVQVRKNRNPFRPLSFIDLGHVDIILWAPPGRPQAFGFYSRPASMFRVFISAFKSQPAQMIRSRYFTRCPAYWRPWEISASGFEATKEYLEQTAEGCTEGSVLYDAVHFNCLHLAHRCLQLAGLNPPAIPTKRVWFVNTPIPDSFIEVLMPGARHSVMYHDLGRRPPEESLAAMRRFWQSHE